VNNFATSELSILLLQNKWAIDSISSQQEITLFDAKAGRNGCNGKPISFGRSQKNNKNKS